MNCFAIFFESGSKIFFTGFREKWVYPLGPQLWGNVVFHDAVEEGLVADLEHFRRLFSVPTGFFQGLHNALPFCFRNKDFADGFQGIILPAE